VDATESDWPLIEGIAVRSERSSGDELEALGAVWEEFVLLGPEDSGYEFLVERVEGTVLGYVCYGPRDLTDGAYDLYHLVVDPVARNQSVGRRLLRAAEAEAREAGARVMVAEISSGARWGSSDAFCLKAGYQAEAVVRDLYAVGEDLVMFVKRF